MYVTSSDLSRTLDRTAIEDFGLRGLVLMENAAHSILNEALDFWPKLKQKPHNILILAGPGQNGGDGWVLARLFSALGHRVESCLIRKPGREVTGDAAVNLEIAKKLKLPIKIIESSADSLPNWEKADLVVDAIFGTGLDRPLDGPAAAVLSKLAGAQRSFKVLAADLPSGLSADTGSAGPEVLRADLSVTLGTYKQGLFLKRGPELAGTVKLGDIGLCGPIFEAVKPKGRLLNDQLAAAFIPLRPNWGHKGTFGHAVVCGGSPGKTGALVLAALGAQRSGCGLITAAHAASLAPIFQSKLTSAMTKPLPQEDGAFLGPSAYVPLAEFAAKCQALGLGPGLGLTPETKSLTHNLVKNLPLPMVIDADAITNLQSNLEILAASKGKRVLTPHPGEAARLLNVTTEQIQDDRLTWVLKLSEISRAVVILKGQYTLIADPDGNFLINDNGGPILAAGGSGDVLTGLLTGLLAQGLEPLAAAGLAVHLHGLAGDLAAGDLGSRGVTPLEVQRYLPGAWKTHSALGPENAN
jgi:NAD(P)H-hydrate epimerase